MKSTTPCVRIKSWYKRKAGNVKLYLKPEPARVLNNIFQSTPYATSVLRYCTFFDTIELLWSLGNFRSIMATFVVVTDFNLYKPATERLKYLDKLNFLIVVWF